MTRRLAIFGGSFNPPGLHHRAIAEELSRYFDEVVVVPCGPRPDKPATNEVDTVARATMVDATFRKLAGVRVDLFDLEQATFTLTHRLDEIYRGEGEVWHVVGTDLTEPGEDGLSFIQRSWVKGAEIWSSLRFAIFVRPGYDASKSELPPHHELFPMQGTGASATIRERVFKHEPIADLVTEEVTAYIERYGLYRGAVMRRRARLDLETPRPFVVVDDRNARATAIAARFERRFGGVGLDAANLIVVIGGDGSMLHAIRKHWRSRFPFLGVNAGHRGFRLNGDPGLENGEIPIANLTIQHSPLLYVETCSVVGERRTALAFNDAWVERASGQTAWLEVKVNDDERLPRLIGDGALVSTAAGSTAYARAMGATPLLVDTPALVLVGSNVMEPPGFKSALLSLDARVSLRTLEASKRPVAAFADGVPLGEVVSFEARVSRIAAVELVFTPGHDMAEKIAQIQFPGLSGQ